MATVTQRGLGKGLSALISENYVQQQAAPLKPTPATPAAEEAGGVYTLASGKLHSGKYQPRRRFDETALMELAESVRANGIMQPIVVRPSPEYPGKYEIVAGERRWRAAQMVALAEVPVIIRDITDKQALELALVENIQRMDLSPLEEASGYQRLIEEFDYTQEELGNVVGKSRSHVANLLRLLALPEEVKEMLDNGELTMGHARAVLTTLQPVVLAREIIKRGFNVRQAEEYCRNITDPGKSSALRPRNPKIRAKDPDIMALEQTLSENLGLKVSINDRGQSGDITIAYDSLSQLDDILRRLGDGV